MTAQLLTTVLLIVYLAGCTESYSLFSPLEPESAVELSAPAAGAILPSGAEFELALQYPPDTSANERATSLIVELRSVSGELIATVALDADALSRPALPPITLPELDPGVYELHYRARAANGEVINERRQLFIAADPIRIANVFVYPPVAEVRSQAIAQAEFVYTAEHQPYVVWTLGTRRVASVIIPWA